MTDRPRAIVRYPSERVLATVDLTTLVRILLQEYGAPLELRFEPMSPAEREETTEDLDGIMVVHDRFHIIEPDGEGGARRPDLEDRAAREGQK